MRQCRKTEAWHSDGARRCRIVGVPVPGGLQYKCRSVGVSERVMLHRERAMLHPRVGSSSVFGSVSESFT